LAQDGKVSAALLDHGQDRSTADALADELIAAAYAHPSDKIVIAETDQLELLITFLRRGFMDASCVSAAREPGPKFDDADILIAPSLHGEADLNHILRFLGGALRPGGVLVIRAAASVASCTQQQVLPIFLKFGFAAV
jgi:hypothetical protein